MIVSEDNVHDALAYLAIDPHPYALAKKDESDTANKVKRAFASAFLRATGGADLRKQQAELDEAHIAAKKEQVDVVLELERHRSRVSAAAMLIEVWRTENANARAAERIR